MSVVEILQVEDLSAAEVVTENLFGFSVERAQMNLHWQGSEGERAAWAGRQ